MIPTIRGLVLLVALIGCPACSPPQPPTGIVLITIDTLRADHLPGYGYPRPVAPFLTHLGKRGVTFDRAISSCSHTAPSHASLFTGLHPPQHKLLANGQPLNPDLVTLPEVASRQGYSTMSVTPARFLTTLAERFGLAVVAPRYQSAEWVVDQGLGWLEKVVAERGTDARFFLWLHFFDVHEWQAPEHVDAAAQKELLSLEGPHARELARWIGRHQGDGLEKLGPEDSFIQMVDAYDAQILAVDRELGRLAHRLRELDLEDSTLWIVASDHGEGLGNHGREGHGRHVYNEQLHVPLIVAPPDRRWRSGRIGELVQLVDLAPTLAKVVGGSLEGVDPQPAGRSLLPLLEGDNRSWQQRPAFSVRRPVDDFRRQRGWLPGEVFSLQGLRYKVIVRSQGQEELFDLQNDPYEVHDLAASRPDDLERFRLLATRVFSGYQELTPTGPVQPIDPRYVEELQALGYL